MNNINMHDISGYYYTIVKYNSQFQKMCIVKEYNKTLLVFYIEFFQVKSLILKLYQNFLFRKTFFINLNQNTLKKQRKFWRTKQIT